MAGTAIADELRHRAREHFELTVLDDSLVRRIERKRHVVVTIDGRELRYHKLVLATGTSALVLPVPGRQRDGVFVCHGLDDAERLTAALEPHRRAAVIGGDPLGIEVARGLRQRGLQTTVVQPADRLMEWQLDRTGATYLLGAMRRLGIDVWLGAQTREFLGDARVTGLRFADGGELSTDVVIMCAGRLPRTELARAAKLACRRGVVVDDQLRTSDADVHALGECAEHRGVCYGPGAPLEEQARVLASHLLGAEAHYTGSLVATRLHVTGIDVFSIGELDDAPGADVMRIEDSARGIYKKLVIQRGRVAGAVLVGDVAPAAALEQAVRAQAPGNDATLALLFGASPGGVAASAAPSRPSPTWARWSA